MTYAKIETMKMLILTLSFFSVFTIKTSELKLGYEGIFHHKVKNQNTSLKQLAKKYYGNVSVADKIASWNKLSVSIEDKLSKDQVIVIKNPVYLPSKTHNTWLKRSGLEPQITLPYS